MSSGNTEAGSAKLDEEMVPCVICKKAVQPRTSNPYFPFCGPRCRQIDLGKWVNEEYRIASEPGASEEENDPEDPHTG